MGRFTAFHIATAGRMLKGKCIALGLLAAQQGLLAGGAPFTQGPQYGDVDVFHGLSFARPCRRALCRSLCGCRVELSRSATESGVAESGPHFTVRNRRV